MRFLYKLSGIVPLIVYIVITSDLAVTGKSKENEGRFWPDPWGESKSNKSNYTKDSWFNFPKDNFTKLPHGNGEHDEKHVGMYNLFTSFVNQTRNTVPEIVHHGNFTLIQTSLLFTIGAMAAGAAVIILEGLAFRQKETEIELYNRLLRHHATSMASLYGPPPVYDYGTPYAKADLNTSYSGPSFVYPDSFNAYQNYQPVSRKKRESVQVEKAYSRNHKHGISNLNSEGTLTHLYTLPYKFPLTVGNRRTHSTYGSGYPEFSNILMMNRLGIKPRRQSWRRKPTDNSDDDDDARSGIKINDPDGHRHTTRKRFWGQKIAPRNNYPYYWFKKHIHF